MSEYIDIIKKRRSYYDLVEGEVVPDQVVESLIADLVTYTPDAFNMQSAKLILLLGEKSSAFWRKVNETLDGKINPDKQKGFENARGTVLFFIDEDIVDQVADRFPKYAENFRLWGQHANGMVQINVWNALRSLDMGASIQHYSPVIDDWVAEDYGTPKAWKLIAQMPFGKIASEPAEKEKDPISERLKVFK